MIGLRQVSTSLLSSKMIMLSQWCVLASIPDLSSCENATFKWTGLAWSSCSCTAWPVDCFNKKFTCPQNWSIQVVMLGVLLLLLINGRIQRLCSSYIIRSTDWSWGFIIYPPSYLVCSSFQRGAFGTTKIQSQTERNYQSWIGGLQSCS